MHQFSELPMSASHLRTVSYCLEFIGGFAIRQAHERIIGERQALNAEKILSLWEGNAAVHVRGKAGAKVKFGSQLLLGEADGGMAVDWELACGNPERGTQLLRQSLARMRRCTATEDRPPNLHRWIQFPWAGVSSQAGGVCG